MLQRFHHSIADGVGMIRMSEQFVDLERDPPEPQPVPFPEAGPLPGPFDTSRRALGHAVGRTIGSLHHGVAVARQTLGHPRQLLDGARQGVEVTRALGSELGAMGAPLSPLWTRRTARRALRLLRVPFADVRWVAREADVTINDVFVAGAAGGAGNYHRLVGSDVSELRMAMPVNTRTDRSTGGNAFGLARLRIPTVADPVARLAMVHERLGRVRTGSRAGVSLVQHLAGWANLLPTPALVRLTRSQVSSVDFTTSNVRGAPFPVFLGGSRVVANHPIGPLTGTAFNLTMLSYDGSLDMGVHIDPGAIEAPDLLVQCLRLAFAELLDR